MKAAGISDANSVEATKMRRRASVHMPMFIGMFLALMSWAGTSHAFGNFGDNVNTECRAFNGTSPYTGDCALCHNNSNLGQRVEPQWTNYLNGNLTAFCPQTPNRAPNGTINNPSGNVSINQGESVSFAGSGSDPDGDPLSYLWDFGGGAANSIAQNPGSVTFNSAGTFTVTFTVFDNAEVSDPTPPTRTITVNSVTNNQAPNGTIVSPSGNQTINVGESVNFAGNGSDPDGNLPLSYAWNFGGGAANRNGQNPGNVAFSTPGTFTVRLTVTDVLGASDTTPPTRQINVIDVTTPPPTEGQCSDGDGDGFSPDGGICGPLDCDDGNANVNPRATEVCGDGVDNDCDTLLDAADPECNGTDCINVLFEQREVNITAASWDGGEQELEVEGLDTEVGVQVRLFHAGTGEQLGQTTVESDGEWDFDVRFSDPADVPCRVRVEIEGGSAEADVSNAPGQCSGGGGTPPPPANNPPLAVDDVYRVQQRRTLRVDAPGLLVNDSDPDGDPLTVELVSGTSNGSLEFNADGSFVYQPRRRFTGTDEFIYRASDGGAESGPAFVTITVEPRRRRDRDDTDSED